MNEAEVATRIGNMIRAGMTTKTGSMIGAKVAIKIGSVTEIEEMNHVF
jgi:predicted TIM-barrel enzyme